MIHDNFCLMDKKQKIMGYFRIARHGFGDGLIVDESSHVTSEAAACIISFMKKLALQRKKPHLRFNLSPVHSLARRAIAAGAEVNVRYAFQIRIGNMLRLLTQLRPLLENVSMKALLRD